MQQVSWVSPLGSGVRSQPVRLVWAGDFRPSRMHLEESCVLGRLEDACRGLQNVTFARGRGAGYPESAEVMALLGTAASSGSGFQNITYVGGGAGMKWSPRPKGSLVLWPRESSEG